MIKLKYVGDGSFFPDIPARDLRDDEFPLKISESDLVKSGLYEKAKRQSLKVEERKEIE